MGSGTSNLNDEQRGHIARLMKENYDKVSKSLPANEVQPHMEKLYEELVNSLKPQKPLDIQRKDQGKKKIPTRRRSYGEDKLKKKDLPPKPPVKSQTGSKTDEAIVQESQALAHHHQDETSPQEVAHHADENVDSWDSVHSQPSCPLCKMIFTTASKYDTHVKYSEVHAQNLARQKQQIDGVVRPSSAPTTEPARPASAPPGPRCRELYTGSKFFWRHKQTVEIHIYLHLTPRCIEICSYNNNQSQEYPRVYLEEPKLVKLIGDQTILDKVNDIKDNIPAQEPTPPDEILEEEAKRLLNSAHIMNRLQFTKDLNTSQERLEYVFAPNPQFPDLPTPLMESPPDGLIPVMIARRRLSTTKEIENAFASFNHLGAELLNSTEKAEKIIDKITLENENLFKQSSENGERRHSK